MLDELHIDEAIDLKDFTEVNEEVEPLWGNRGQPAAFLKKENPRHRAVIELKATGKYTNKEIAEILSYSPISINYILRQPWAEELLVKLIRKEGASEREAVFRFLDGLTIEAVQAQAEILRMPLGEKTCEPIRKVSNDILNRAFGTPVHKTEDVGGEDLSKLSDAEIAQRLSKYKERGMN